MNALMAEITRRCRQQGISRVPDRRTVRARVDGLPLSEVVRARAGAKAAKDAFRPVRGTLVAEYPLEIVQFDHTLADVVVVDELHRQPLQRPWLTLGVDVASRVMTGFYLSLEAPSSLSIALALTQSVLPKETRRSWPSATHWEELARFEVALTGGNSVEAWGGPATAEETATLLNELIPALGQALSGFALYVERFVPWPFARTS